MQQQQEQVQHSPPSTLQHELQPSEQAMVPHDPQEEMTEINLEHVSLSLRLTCEMNRRLLQGIRNNNLLVGARLHTNTNNPLLQRGGDDTGMNVVTPQHHPVNIHPSQSWQPPIRSSREEEEELTLFHAKSPRSSTKQQRRGAARWGPELSTYLEYLVGQVLEVPSEQRSLILALALQYLDRACSVETVRTSGCPKCPFVTPRTVHRLLLISLLTATRAVSQTNDAETDKVHKTLGIPPTQLEQMQHFFMHALGDNGLYVDPTHLEQFMMKWRTRFEKRKQPPPVHLQQHAWA